MLKKEIWKSILLGLIIIGLSLIATATLWIDEATTISLPDKIIFKALAIAGLTAMYVCFDRCFLTQRTKDGLQV